MKFGALLRSSAQVMPELQGLFNCYKQLKKRLKRLPERSGQPLAPDGLLHGSSAVKAHERAFVALLVSDIQAFNETFVEREEQSVIKLSLIEQRNAPNLRASEIAALYKSFVDFHGQTLMLVHWSILAYTSVLKILKKHHKRTGLQVQEFNLQQLLSQPFCSVELISDLVRKAEAKAQELATRLSQQQQQVSISTGSPESSPVEKLISAARQSVREIAVSAAHGNAALDEHLREQPTTSEELSVDAGEAEVASKQPEAGATSKAQQIVTAGVSNVQGNDVEGDKEVGGTTKMQGSKRKREDNAPHLQRQAKAQMRQPDNTSKDARIDAPAGKIVLPQILTRAGSVAGDNSTPKGDNNLAAPSPAPDPRISGTSGKSCAHDSNSGEQSRRSPPQLTMGQGWRGGSQNILRQTQMALGLWEQLHDTASTPSTIVPPPGQLRTSMWERGSANSAA